MTPPRRISAGDTFFGKFIISGAFLIGAVMLVAGIVRRWVRPDERGLAVFQTLGDIACIGLALSVVWRLAGVKRVAWDEDGLHISNFLKQIVVPLSDIETVDQIEGTGYRVVIRFARDSRFGRQIRFSPIGFTHPRPHPIVAELATAVAAAKA